MKKKSYIENMYETLHKEIKKGHFEPEKNSAGFYVIKRPKDCPDTSGFSAGKKKRIQRFMKHYSTALKLNGWLK